MVNLLYSEDGKSWRENDNTTPLINNPYGFDPTPWTQWGGIAYGDGKFVANACTDLIMLISDDGINWIYNIATKKVRDMTFGNGKFVALDQDSDNILVITPYIEENNQLHKITTIASCTNDLRKIINANGRFYAVGRSGRATMSNDGTNWFLFTIPVFDDIRALRYADMMNMFFIVSDKGVYYTYDWYNWNLLREGDYTDVCFARGKFVIIGTSDTILSNEVLSITAPETPLLQLHFSTWTKTSIEYQIKDICYGNGYYYCVTKADKGNLLYYSTDFNTWTTPETIKYSYTIRDGGISSIFYRSDIGAFVCSTGYIFLSSCYYYIAYSVTAWENGNFSYQTSTSVTTDASEIITMCSGNGGICAITKTWFGFTNNTYIYAHDTKLTTNQDVCFGDGKFVIISGSDDGTGYTTDGENMTISKTGTNCIMSKVCYGNNIFLTIGTSGKGAISKDGVEWTPKDIPIFNEIRKLRFFNCFFFVITDIGVYYTYDAEEWNTLYEGTNDECYDLIYVDNKIFIVGYAGYYLSTTITANELKTLLAISTEWTKT